MAFPSLSDVGAALGSTVGGVLFGEQGQQAGASLGAAAGAGLQAALPPLPGTTPQAGTPTFAPPDLSKLVPQFPPLDVGKWIGPTPGSGATPGTTPGTTPGQDRTERLYCPPSYVQQGYTQVVAQAGPVGPEWGQPLSESLGLKAGDPCPGTAQADMTERLYCPPGYPNVIAQRGPVGPEWGQPLSATLGLKAGDPCPPEGLKLCAPGYQYDVARRTCVPKDQMGMSGIGAVPTGYDASGRPIYGQGGVVTGYDQWGNPVYADQQPAATEGAFGSMFGDLFGGLPAGAFMGGGPPDWFWLLWLLTRGEKDTPQTRAQAAQDWAQDPRNPTMGAYKPTFAPAQPAPAPTRMGTYSPTLAFGTPQAPPAGKTAPAPSCPAGQAWNATLRKCLPTFQTKPSFTFPTPAIPKPTFQAPTIPKPTFQAPTAPAPGQVSGPPTLGGTLGQIGSTLGSFFNL